VEPEVEEIALQVRIIFSEILMAQGIGSLHRTGHTMDVFSLFAFTFLLV
jgi:hypothetical protein